MKDHNKKLIGPGGIRCHCCRKGSVKWTRTALNRQFRRAFNQEIKKANAFIHYVLTANKILI